MYLTNEYAFITYAIKEGNLKKVLSENKLDKDFNCVTSPDDLYSYVRIEEIVGNYKHCEELFQKWMTYKPGEYPWLTYIKFEIRIGEKEKAKELFQQVLQEYPTELLFNEWYSFELYNGNQQSMRNFFHFI